MRLLPLCALLALCACAGNRPAPITSPAMSSSRGAAHPQPKSVQLLKEANRLADEVKAGRLTRVEAADELNGFRLRLVGSNAIDDATFATYRAIAVARDGGTMTTETAQARMLARLREAQRRWASSPRRPVEPAFTNFLLHVYDLPPLDTRS